VLHPDLEPYRDTNFIGRINRAYESVQREFRDVDARDLRVEVQSSLDASRLKELFTIRLSYEANQWLFARGTACDVPFELTLPFHNGLTFPYSLKMELISAAPVAAELRQWFIGGGRWFATPPSRVVSKRLGALRLPRIGWVHNAGGWKHTLHRGGLILPPDDDFPTNRWIVQSAYQGFLFGIRPRIGKHLRAARRLQLLLANW
jgi:hypothetical protein